MEHLVLYGSERAEAMSASESDKTDGRRLLKRAIRDRADIRGFYAKNKAKQKMLVDS